MALGRGVANHVSLSLPLPFLLEFTCVHVVTLGNLAVLRSNPLVALAVTVPISTAFRSMLSGACAFVGRMNARATWRLWIITKGELT